MNVYGADAGRPIDLSERKSSFDQYIDRDGAGGCWLWTGFRTKKGPEGYGRLQLSKHRAVLAHRAVYTALVGPIPAGMTIDHLCRVKQCVNPAHLEVVTHAENCLRRAPRPLSTTCQRGHELTSDNTYAGTNGHRHCRVCLRANWADKRARMRAAA